MKEFVLKVNTDLCMDVKTILHSDSISKIGKDYQGVLTRDTDEHFTFIETIPELQTDEGRGRFQRRPILK